MQGDIRYAHNKSLPYMSSLTGDTMGLLDPFFLSMKNVNVLILSTCSLLILLHRIEKDKFNISAPFQTTPLQLFGMI